MKKQHVMVNTKCPPKKYKNKSARQYCTFCFFLNIFFVGKTHNAFGREKAYLVFENHVHNFGGQTPSRQPRSEGGAPRRRSEHPGEAVAADRRVFSGLQDRGEEVESDPTQGVAQFVGKVAGGIGQPKTILGKNTTSHKNAGFLVQKTNLVTTAARSSKSPSSSSSSLDSSRANLLIATRT